MRRKGRAQAEEFVDGDQPRLLSTRVRASNAMTP
jgi:hypothetical protein